MNKITIFSLIILSSLVTNVQAAIDYQPSAEMRVKEMREKIQSLAEDYYRILRIEDQANKLTELENLELIADNVEDFLKRNQQHGVGGLHRVREIQRGIAADIKRLRASVMDIDTDDLD